MRKVACGSGARKPPALLRSFVCTWEQNMTFRAINSSAAFTRATLCAVLPDALDCCCCCCCCCCVAPAVPDSVRPQRRQPTRLPHPWDSPGKNTGVGCHCLLQCVKVRSESEVAQSCPTLSDPMDCSLPGSSTHGISQARVLEWGAIAFSASLHDLP